MNQKIHDLAHDILPKMKEVGKLEPIQHDSLFAWDNDILEVCL